MLLTWYQLHSFYNFFKKINFILDFAFSFKILKEEESHYQFIN